jgi:hypothetical protein
MDTRLELLKREAKASNFRFLPISNIPLNLELEELAACLYSQTHERQVPPYGVVFCKRALPPSETLRLIPLDDTSVRVYRQFADGRRSFLIYSPHGKRQFGLLRHAFGDEYTMLQLSNMVRGIVLQRQQGGLVKIVQGGEVYTIRGRTWSVKRSVSAAYDRIIASLGNIKVPDFGETIFGLLNICYYSLSPDGIGATLVWCLTDVGERPGADLRPLGISVRDPSSYRLASHILRYQDGASFVLSTGELATTGAHLTYSARAAENVKLTHGTRHTSAARFTFDHSDTMAFVVSQDGLVTVFSDGMNVAELPIEEAAREVDWLKRISPRGKRSDISGCSFTMQCPSCGRYVVIEEVTVLGWKDDEEVDCPICKGKLYSSMCFSLNAYPIKYPPKSASTIPGH